MHPSLKQRLVGGVVLVALAVIFLPMLLPGNGDSTMPLFGSNVPNPPGTHFEPIEIPLQLPPAQPQSEVTVVDRPQPGDTASNEKPQPPVEAAAAPAFAPSTEDARPAPAAPTPTSKPAAQAASSAKPMATPARAAGSTEAWAVQLGSFTSSVNALTLQEKARKAGFRAYVEKVKGGQGTSYRVRVGPESSRTRADALRERIADKLKMSGMVVAHQP